MRFPNPTGDLAYFPEEAFLPLPQYERQYYDTRDRGREIMSKAKVVITGLARDVGKVLPKSIARMVRLGNMFDECKVVIYENDSKDDTLDQLKDWERVNENVCVLSERRADPVNPGTRCLKRAERMAIYRNRCREHIITHFPEYNYVIIVDMDLNTGFSYDGIANTFGWKPQEDWHMVGSNGILYKDYGGVRDRPLHFDVWAFRWQGSYKPTHAFKINPRHWRRGEPLHPLFSCFGGVGVYVMDAFKKSHYDGTDCEHVPFHRHMREAGLGRLFMNPSQIVVY